MRRVFVPAVVLTLLLSGLTSVRADYLRVSRSATIKAEPRGDADILERVSEGTLLPLLDTEQENGYYRTTATQLAREGWIYRTLVRRFPGNMPAPDPGTEPADPLEDPTLHLTDAQRGYAARHLRLGKPQAVFERVREGYVTAQDGRLKIPVWVQYELSSTELNGPAERTNDYREDASIPFIARATNTDYDGSGYARGHLAPAEDMDRSNNVMSQSFLLSNMAPQIGPQFNGSVWRVLEDAVRGWVEQRRTLTIIAGPVFMPGADSVRYDVIGNNNVAVPTHFYKIVVDATDLDNPEALAFLMPNDTLTGRDYADFLVSIDSVETLTGLDVLRNLPAPVQEPLERTAAAEVW